MRAYTGDTKVGTSFVSLYVVVVCSDSEPRPTVAITDPALRPANATELGAEAPNQAPTSGYVYA